MSMDLEDDFWVLSLVSRGWVSLLFFVLFVAAGIWKCQHDHACEEKGGVYVDEHCVKKDSLIDVPQDAK